MEFDQLIFNTSIAEILSRLLYNGEYTKKLSGRGIPVVQLAVADPSQEWYIDNQSVPSYNLV